MMRLTFAAVAALAGVSFGPTAQAYEAPWCEVAAQPTMSSTSAYLDAGDNTERPVSIRRRHHRPFA